MTLDPEQKEIYLWAYPPSAGQAGWKKALIVHEVHAWLKTQSQSCAGFLVEAQFDQVSFQDGQVRMHLPLVGVGWDDGKGILAFLAGDREAWAGK